MDIKKEYNQIYFPDGLMQSIEIEEAKAIVKEMESFFHLSILIKKYRAMDTEDKFLKKQWNKEYESKIEKLKKFDEYACLIKFYSYGIKERSNDLNDITNQKFIRARKIFTKIIKLIDIAFEAYSILKINSNMKDISIKNEHIMAVNKDNVYPVKEFIRRGEEYRQNY